MDTMNVPEGGKKTVYAYIAIFGAVVVLMMLLGIIMRAAQGGSITIGADVFYQIMTAHGVGMVGIAGLGGAAIMWYFLRQYVVLHTGILITNLLLFLVGVVCILSAIFLGKFGGAWTFLFPLPGQSMGAWSAGAAVLFLTGLLLVGVGFLLFYLDAGRGLIAEYGSFAKSLGWPQLFGKDDGNAPPPTVVASTMVTIVNTLALVVGASILLMMIINILMPSFEVNALLAKNMIYFFGHTFINATIYMAIIAVYEILPRYTDRPWKSNKVFLAAWTASTIMVLIVYPHHLFMDFAMPTWMLVMGQIISYTSGLPVLLVTTIGTLAIVYRSGIKWDMASALLFLSIFGWAGGVIPAVIDGTIAINQVMHNTMWVPGHFHFYLILGMVAMVFGFMYYLIKEGRKGTDSALDRGSFWIYAISGTAFVFMFLISGKEGVARRFAVHFPEWQSYSNIATVIAIFVLLGTVVFTLRFIFRLGARAT
jgi:cytochrome c oxidase subunit 1